MANTTSNGFRMTALTTEVARIEAQEMRPVHQFTSIPAISGSVAFFNSRDLLRSTVVGITSAMSEVKISVIPPAPKVVPPITNGPNSFAEWLAPQVEVKLPPLPPGTPSNPWFEFLRYQQEERRLQEQKRRSSPVYIERPMRMDNICTKSRHLHHGEITLELVDETMKVFIRQLPLEAFCWSGGIPMPGQALTVWASPINSLGGGVVCRARRCFSHPHEGDMIVTIQSGSTNGYRQLVVYVPFAYWRKGYEPRLWNGFVLESLELGGTPRVWKLKGYEASPTW
ncbi:hypothetical protein FRB94_011618 [Tulasnella sp. JGI-2019a]|nr:hypothetical protein FRB93_008024 [Tulasnella sp. JGI-2019a]KAG8992413.1 hypothetical protein FRB94_011618 [Tulasnella sp. JGI-2019a]